MFSITDRITAYTPAFKLAALKTYEDGQTPMEIFLQAGFDVDAIGLFLLFLFVRFCIKT
ncbi:hypothetical protein M5W70_15830 [Paenibacillus larvae]|uniref:hypothetical protein n=1 Tax=Paenibacillus larvae TaxID=1464 RepID=UPI00228179E8|nr:hypothetical protein [Paenibacillus larvae]MCY9690120.1 hypothetical protein [Paenibacillus larvae]